MLAAVYVEAFLPRVAMETGRCRAACRWLWRQRIRLHLEGTGINPTPVDLHEQQLSLEQHSQAHRITTLGLQQRRTPPVLRSSGPPGQDGFNRCCLLSQGRQRTAPRSPASSPSEA